MSKNSTYDCPICTYRRGFPVRHYAKSIVGTYHREILAGLKEPTCPKCNTVMDFERWKAFPFCDNCKEKLFGTKERSL